MCAVRCGDRQRASAASALDLVFGSAFGALISLLSFFPCSKVVTPATLCVRRSNLCRSLLFRLFPITYIRIHSSAPSILHSSIHPTVAHPPMVHWSVHTRSPSPSCSLLLILPFFSAFLLYFSAHDFPFVYPSMLPAPHHPSSASASFRSPPPPPPNRSVCTPSFTLGSYHY